MDSADIHPTEGDAFIKIDMGGNKQKALGVRPCYLQEGGHPSQEDVLRYAEKCLHSNLRMRNKTLRHQNGAHCDRDAD